MFDLNWMEIAAGFAAERAWELATLLRARAEGRDPNWVRKVVAEVETCEPGFLTKTERRRLSQVLSSGALARVVPPEPRTALTSLIAERVFVDSADAAYRSGRLLGALWQAVAATMTASELITFLEIMQTQRRLDHFENAISRLTASLARTDLASDQLRKLLEEQRANIVPLLPLRPPKVVNPDPMPSLISLLMPRFAVGSFVGRTSVLMNLKTWLQRDERTALCVLVGRAGSGKSRLAVEFTEASLDLGWAAGFLPVTCPADMAKIASWRRPRLVVIDDCETRVADTTTLLELGYRYASRDEVIRVVLVFRSRLVATNVLEVLNRASEETVAFTSSAFVLDLDEYPLSRVELDSIFTEMQTRISPSRRPVEAAASKSHPQYETPLEAAMAAAGAAGPEAGSAAVDTLLESELDRLVSSAAHADLSLSRATVRSVCAACALWHPLTRAAGHRILEAICHDSDPTLSERRLDWLEQLSMRPPALGVLCPETLADRLVEQELRSPSGPPTFTKLFESAPIDEALAQPLLVLERLLSQEPSLVTAIARLLDNRAQQLVGSLGDAYASGHAFELDAMALHLSNLLLKIPLSVTTTTFDWPTGLFGLDTLAVVVMMLQYNELRAEATDSGTQDVLRRVELLLRMAGRLADLKRVEEGMPLAVLAVAITRAIHEETKELPYAQWLAHALFQSARFMGIADRPIEAVAYAEEASELFELIYREIPGPEPESNLAPRANLITCLIQLATYYDAVGLGAEAVSARERATELVALARDESAEELHARLFVLADRWSNGNRDVRLNTATELTELARRAVGTIGPRMKHELVGALVRMGQARLEVGDGAGAAEAFEEALATRSELGLPVTLADVREVSQMRYAIGESRALTGEYSEAAQSYEECLKQLDTLKEVPELQTLRCDALLKLNLVLETLGEAEDAHACLRDALCVACDLVSDGVEDALKRYWAATGLYCISLVARAPDVQPADDDIEALRRAGEVIPQGGEPSGFAHVAVLRTKVAIMFGEHDSEAVRVLDVAGRVFQRLGDDFGLVALDDWKERATRAISGGGRASS